MKKALIIIIGLIVIGAGIFFYGYSQAAKNRRYAQQVGQLFNQVPTIPELAESNWSEQVQYWQVAVEKINQLGLEGDRFKAPKGSEKLAAMVSEILTKVRDGLGEIKFLAFSEKIEAAVIIPETKNREEAEREVTAAIQRLEALMQVPESEQGPLGPQFNEKAETARKAFEEYRKNLQRGLADIKQGKSVDYLNAQKFGEALKSLQDDVISSLKGRLGAISNLRVEIEKEKSRLFVW